MNLKVWRRRAAEGAPRGATRVLGELHTARQRHAFNYTKSLPRGSLLYSDIFSNFPYFSSTSLSLSALNHSLAILFPCILSPG